MSRQYDSSRRAARAARTRERILDAACALFTDHGFAAASVADIADRAGVAAATVHAAGTKGSLLLEAVMREFTSGRAVSDTSELGSAFAEPDTERALDIASDFFTDAHARSARLWGVVHSAAALDDTVARQLEDLDRRRRAELQVAAEWFIARGLATAGREKAIADTLAYATDSAAYRHFVLDCGWSDDAYRQWLRTQLATVGLL